MTNTFTLKTTTIAIVFYLLTFFPTLASTDHTVARRWNEVLLEGIRNDYARPTVHARNLFHISAAMYDSWAVYMPVANTYFLGREINGFTIPFEGMLPPDNVEAAIAETLSYACYRLIEYRFEYSPDADETMMLADELMSQLGYDKSVKDKDYTSGNAAALGNYLAEQIILFGEQDGSNEMRDFDNKYYEPVNDPMVVAKPGNPDIKNPNRWQPLAFDVFIDQSGNEIPGFESPFLSPEWGNTVPFSLTDEHLTIHQRDGDTYRVYHDPGPPAYIDTTNDAVSTDYKWGFSLVSIWSAHLDPADNVQWDISPGGIGNLKLENLPTTISGLQDFYNQIDGGDPSTGYTLNPKTGEPYEKQMVPRGDYSRVLAEFWADGPDSETPPGHWFTILNYVNDHPELVKKFKGEGELLSDLEWDIKSYFALGGAMHDAAISAWSVKGYYDYIRPVSAIRFMADQGQSSDPQLPSYHKAGIPLVEDYIELVKAGDPLAGENNEHVGKIKLYAWQGPDYITDPATDMAGVGWILAENWWPYQRPTFITPPFAGYVSGHSTYSRAAAKVLTLLTGDEYFPGGMGEFEAPKNEFLVFEEGPSVDITLQWAKYNDASDQCSLSRIWGGIHPPVDDIPGRLIGEKVGIDAFAYAEAFFNGRVVLSVDKPENTPVTIYPNPVRPGETLSLSQHSGETIKTISLLSTDGKKIMSWSPEATSLTTSIVLPDVKQGLYLLQTETNNNQIVSKLKIETK